MNKSENSLKPLNEILKRLPGLRTSLEGQRRGTEYKCNNERDFIETITGVRIDSCAESTQDSTVQLDVGIHLIDQLSSETLDNDVYYSDVICASRYLISLCNEKGKVLKELLLEKCRGKQRDVKKDLASQDFPHNKYSERAVAEILRNECPIHYVLWHKRWLQGTYRSIFGQPISPLKGIQISIEDMAVFLYKIFWLDYIYCENTRPGKWYKMENGILRPKEQAVEEMYSILSDKNRIWNVEYKGCNISSTYNEISRPEYENANFKIVFEAFYKFICNKTHIRSVCDTLKNKMSLRFSKDFNSDIERMLWNNGYMTVATRTGIKIVRPHIEDLYYMTAKCGIEPIENPPCPEMRKLLIDWLEKVYPEQTYEFILTDWAGLLRGGNPFKLLRCYTGTTGNNSKTSIISLLVEMLGDYVQSTNISILMNQNNTSATTELVKAIYTRLVVINETGVSQKCDPEQIKSLTGCDYISTRALFTESKSNILFAKIIVVCNEIFKVENADVATQKRFEISPHIAKWVDNPEDMQYKGLKNIHKIDPDFTNKAKKLNSTLAWILVHEYYPKFVEWLKDSSKRKLPPMFQHDQKKQWIRICDLSGFVDGFVKKTGDMNDKISIEDLIREYNFSRGKSPTNDINILKDKMISLCFQGEHIVNDFVHGYTLNKKQNTPMAKYTK